MQVVEGGDASRRTDEAHGGRLQHGLFHVASSCRFILDADVLGGEWREKVILAGMDFKTRHGDYTHSAGRMWSGGKGIHWR